MKRRLTVRHESWPLARPFAISRGVKTTAEVVVVEIEDANNRGRGECTPYPRYGETVRSVIDEIEFGRTRIEGGLTPEALCSYMRPGAARNAVDCALWDLAAKNAGKRAWELAGFTDLCPMITAETVGLGPAEEMATRAAELSDAPLLKIKLDSNDVEGRLNAIRSAAPKARLIVDPNEGWSVSLLRKKLEFLREIGVEMLEQPVPVDCDEELAMVNSQVPICADEACHTTDDLDRLVGRYDIVNIKLDKTGGLTEAIRLKRRAQEMGFGIMIGCMVGTSLAMAPATVIAQNAKFVDLDGALLLKEDRDYKLKFKNGVLYPPEINLWG